MKKILYTTIALAAALLLTCCQTNYLSVSSPNKMDDTFVTSSVSETFKTLSMCYRTALSLSGGGNYNWNDSETDCEYYPEYNSGNGRVGYLDVDKVPITDANGNFNNLFSWFNSFFNNRHLRNNYFFKNRSFLRSDDFF